MGHVGELEPTCPAAGKDPERAGVGVQERFLAVWGCCFHQISMKHQLVIPELPLEPSQKEDFDSDWIKVRTNRNLLHLSLTNRDLCSKKAAVTLLLKL